MQRGGQHQTTNVREKAVWPRETKHILYAYYESYDYFLLFGAQVPGFDRAIHSSQQLRTVTVRVPAGTRE